MRVIHHRRVGAIGIAAVRVVAAFTLAMLVGDLDYFGDYAEYLAVARPSEDSTAFDDGQRRIAPI